MPQPGDGDLWPTTDDDRPRETPSTPVKDAVTHQLPAPEEPKKPSSGGWFDPPPPPEPPPGSDKSHAERAPAATWPLAELEREAKKPDAERTVSIRTLPSWANSAQSSEPATSNGDAVEDGAASEAEATEASQPAGQSSEVAGEASEPADETSEAVDKTSEAAGEASQSGDRSSQSGDRSSQSGDRSSQSGDRSSEAGEQASEAADGSSQPSGQSSEAGDQSEADDRAGESGGQLSVTADSAEEAAESAEEGADSAEVAEPAEQESVAAEQESAAERADSVSSPEPEPGEAAPAEVSASAAADGAGSGETVQMSLPMSVPDAEGDEVAGSAEAEPSETSQAEEPGAGAAEPGSGETVQMSLPMPGDEEGGDPTESAEQASASSDSDSTDSTESEADRETGDEQVPAPEKDQRGGDHPTVIGQVGGDGTRTGLRAVTVNKASTPAWPDEQEDRPTGDTTVNLATPAAEPPEPTTAVERPDSAEAPEAAESSKTAELPKPAEVPEPAEEPAQAEGTTSATAPKPAEPTRTTEPTRTAEPTRSAEPARSAEPVTESAEPSRTAESSAVAEQAGAGRSAGTAESSTAVERTESPQVVESSKTAELPKPVESAAGSKTAEPSATAGPAKAAAWPKSDEAPQPAASAPSAEHGKAVEPGKTAEWPKAPEASTATEAPQVPEPPRTTEPPKATEPPKVAESPKTVARFDAFAPAEPVDRTAIVERPRTAEPSRTAEPPAAGRPPAGREATQSPAANPTRQDATDSATVFFPRPVLPPQDRPKTDPPSFIRPRPEADSTTFIPRIPPPTQLDRQPAQLDRQAVSPAQSEWHPPQLGQQPEQRQQDWPPPEPPRAAPQRVGPQPQEPAAPRKKKPLLIAAIALVAVLGLAAGVVFAVPGLAAKLGLASGDAVATAPPPAPITYRPGLHGPDTSAPKPTKDGVAAALAGPISSPALGNVAGVVIDPATGETLYERNAGAAITPASTGKILTAAAALLSLDHTEQLVTKVVQGEQPGEVIIVGGGDPTISSLPDGEVSMYPGAAHLDELVEQVRNSGVQVQTVYIDQSRYTGPGLAPSWLPEDVGEGYIAPIVPAMLDGDREDPKVNYSPRTTDPGRKLVDAFASRIGATAAGAIEKKAPANAKVLGEIRSAPLAQLVDNMLDHSDNTLGDILAREVAVKTGEEASFDGASRAMLNILRQNGFDVDGVVLRDGSGMSIQNKMSAKVLAQVLAVAAGPDGKDPRTNKLRPLLGGLPVAGGSGTLEDRYGTDGAAAAGRGWVRAKTGTLSGVNSLAGIVLDQDNRPLVFAFLTEGTQQNSARPALDVVAAALRGCGCQ